MDTLPIRSLLIVVVSLSYSPIARAEPAPTKKPVSAKVKELQKERLQALEDAYGAVTERVKLGREPMMALSEYISELTEARLELAENDEAIIKIYERGIAVLRQCDKEAQEMNKAGLMTKSVAAQMKAQRLKMEIELEKFKSK